MARQRTFGTYLLALLASLALLAHAPLAAAADATSGEALVEAQRSEAKLRFERGVQHYRAARYGEAVSAFLEADRLVPSPALSFNIARAYEQLGDTSNALRWYRDYLRRDPQAKNAADVRARISALALALSRSGLQQLTVLSEPSGATVSIDGSPLGVTPFTAELPPGKHRVLLGLAGYRETGSDVLLATHLPGELSLALQTEARSVPGPVSGSAGPLTPSADRPEGSRRFGVAPWLVAGTGVLGLGGALGFELARRADERAARRAQTQLEYQRELEQSERKQTTARVLLGVGGSLVITGGVMLVFNQRNDRTQAATRMGLGCTPEGCTAVAGGSF